MPRQNPSGGKEWLDSIPQAGNRYLRQMQVVGAMAMIRHAERQGTTRLWRIRLPAKRAKTVAAAALANKTARMVGALMTSGEHYQEPSTAAASRLSRVGVQAQRGAAPTMSGRADGS